VILLNKKFFFFDIDGTLTSAKKFDFIIESTYKTIQQLQNQGHFVAIATGRAAFRARDFMKRIGIHHAICEGGNMVIIDDEVISYEPIDQKLAQQIYYKAQSLNIGTAIAHEDSRHRLAPDSRFIDHTADFSAFMDVEIIENFHIEDYPSLRRLFLAMPYEDAHLIPELKQLGIMHYDNQFLIIEPDDKYKGILKAVELMNGKPEDVVVFGDGINDVKMFEKAPFSIAMGNAVDEVKALASYITTDSDDDGVYLGEHL
jgi:Cof subfamily protein (haloacid dehalogenase superfamily)